MYGRQFDADVPEMKQARITPSHTQIIQAVAATFAVQSDAMTQLRGGPGRIAVARGAAMYLCQAVGMMTLAQIAALFGLAGYGSAWSSIRQFEDKCRDGVELAEIVGQLREDLTCNANNET